MAALRVSAALALFLVLSLVAVAHCAVVPREEAAADYLAATKASLSVADGEGLLRLPSREDSTIPDEVVPVEEEEAVPVEPVAEPDPDRSNPESVDNGVEELTAEKVSIEGQEDEENTEEKIHGDEDEHEEEKEKEKKGKKQHGGDRKGKKKEKKMKKHHQSSDDEEEDEGKTKKKIHHHRHRVEKEKTKKRPCHGKNNRSNNGDDSDDEDEEHEKKAKRWRKKAISRSMFGHGRRSQREEAAKEEVKN